MEDKANTNQKKGGAGVELFEELSRLLAAGPNPGAARISRVHVAETPGAGVTYWEAP